MIDILLPHFSHWRIRSQIKTSIELVILQSQFQLLREPSFAIFWQVLLETLFAECRSWVNFTQLVHSFAFTNEWLVQPWSFIVPFCLQAVWKLLLILGHFPFVLIVKVLFSFLFIFISFYLFSNWSEVSLVAAFGNERADELWLLVFGSLRWSEVVGAAWVAKHLDFSIFFLQVDLLVHVAAVALFFQYDWIWSSTLIDFAFDYFNCLSSMVGTTTGIGLKIGAFTWSRLINNVFGLAFG